LSQLFPRWANQTPRFLALGFLLFILIIILLLWYYGSPNYLNVGYRPKQPVDYSHKLHAGDLGIDCRYCHTYTDMSSHANVPSTQTCMNCHQLIGTDNQKLLPVRESWSTGKPIEWIKVHDLPDYCYFDHSAHVLVGVGCISCHGDISKMIIVQQQKPLSMGWCLDCHREPGPHLRTVDEITNMDWHPGPDHEEFVNRIIKEKNINPPEDCSACHR
jgi:hypothetical protein